MQLIVSSWLCAGVSTVRRCNAATPTVRMCGLPIPQCHTRDEERECSRAGVNGLGYGHADQRTDVTVDLPDIAARELQGLLQILIG
jgi:hypothetical protein